MVMGVPVVSCARQSGQPPGDRVVRAWRVRAGSRVSGCAKREALDECTERIKSMKQAHGLTTVIGSMVVISMATVGGLVSATQAGGEYFDVTTVFVAEEGYGGGGHDMEYYGSSSGVTGWSVGTTSCNRGNIVAPWYGGTDQTPVIAQNCYRYMDGRFEQIGMSWLKHSFCAVSEPGCDTWDGGGCEPTSCNTLGVGCADTYWADLNADADAPRSEINAYTGEYQYPFTLAPSGPSSIRGKMQLIPADIQPSANGGARYFVEGQYVEPGEYVYGVHMNNASYKEVSFNSTSNTSGVGVTQHMIPGIYAWQVCDPAVVIQEVLTVEADGGQALGHVGFRASDNGDGTWHYEYVVHNQNSHRSFRSFSVPVPDCVELTNIEFVDVHYHSGEVIEGTDWDFDRSNGEVNWSTQSESANSNANAIRWATMYTFRFDADTSPISVDGSLGYYRSGPGDGVMFDLEAPGPDCGGGNECPGDINGDNTVNVEDILDVLADFGLDSGSGDADGDGDTDVEDLLLVIGEFGNDC